MIITFSIVTYHQCAIVIFKVPGKLLMIQRLFNTIKPYILILTKVD